MDETKITNSIRKTQVNLKYLLISKGGTQSEISLKYDKNPNGKINHPIQAVVEKWARR